MVIYLFIESSNKGNHFLFFAIYVILLGEGSPKNAFLIDLPEYFNLIKIDYNSFDLICFSGFDTIK